MTSHFVKTDKPDTYLLICEAGLFQLRIDNSNGTYTSKELTLNESTPDDATNHPHIS